MEKRDFEKCQICRAPLDKIAYDSPIYCDACVASMFKLNLSPNQYVRMLSTKTGGKHA